MIPGGIIKDVVNTATDVAGYAGQGLSQTKAASAITTSIKDNSSAIQKVIDNGVAAGTWYFTGQSSNSGSQGSNGNPQPTYQDLGVTSVGATEPGYTYHTDSGGHLIKVSNAYTGNQPPSYVNNTTSPFQTDINKLTNAGKSIIAKVQAKTSSFKLTPAEKIALTLVGGVSGIALLQRLHIFPSLTGIAAINIARAYTGKQTNTQVQEPAVSNTKVYKSSHRKGHRHYHIKNHHRVYY
jgi:hypothetical protein